MQVKFRLIALIFATALVSIPSSDSHSANAQKKYKNHVVIMTIEKRGSIIIELLQSEAPKTVEHFLALANSKFYDGIRFHRLEKILTGLEQYGVLQGGDPGTKKLDAAAMIGKTGQELNSQYGIGNGGSGKTVPLEASSSVHSRGTLGMARNSELNSGDSQFFFNLLDNHQWDYKYCMFGRVIKGLEVMDAARQGDKITSIRYMTKTGSKTKTPRTEQKPPLR